MSINLSVNLHEEAESSLDWNVLTINFYELFRKILIYFWDPVHNS